MSHTPFIPGGQLSAAKLTGMAEQTRRLQQTHSGGYGIAHRVGPYGPSFVDLSNNPFFARILGTPSTASGTASRITGPSASGMPEGCDFGYAWIEIQPDGCGNWLYPPDARAGTEKLCTAFPASPNISIAVDDIVQIIYDGVRNFLILNAVGSGTGGEGKQIWIRITGQLCAPELGIDDCNFEFESVDNPAHCPCDVGSECDPPIDPMDEADFRQCLYSWEHIISDLNVDSGIVGDNPGCHMIVQDACGYVDRIPAKEVTGRTGIPVGAIVLGIFTEDTENPTNNHYTFKSIDSDCYSDDGDLFEIQQVVSDAACGKDALTVNRTYWMIPPCSGIRIFADPNSALACNSSLNILGQIGGVQPDDTC